VFSVVRSEGGEVCFKMRAVVEHGWSGINTVSCRHLGKNGHRGVRSRDARQASSNRGGTLHPSWLIDVYEKILPVEDDVVETAVNHRIPKLLSHRIFWADWLGSLVVTISVPPRRLATQAPHRCGPVILAKLGRGD